MRLRVRSVVRAVVAATAVVVVVVVGGAMSGCSGGGSGGAAVDPGATYAAQAEVRASGAGSYRDGTPTAELPDPAWLDTVAAATGIPRRALQGYAGAAIASNEVRPECRLGWNTLAGIGWVESHHGTIFGGSILDSGVTSAPIIGVPLDGDGFQEIPDTDAGAVDGDTEWDRAVGPMQFVPATWAAWATEANGDGVPDINNVDDASLSAAEYLCFSAGRGGGAPSGSSGSSDASDAPGDLGTEAGWRAAIAGYNESPAYLDEVLDHANRYATEAADALGSAG
ncbi:lytic murein transglycosylase [Herbiconiux sp. CPCC 205716]|uniref:Lytic murein transglycosylase n=1 Tax=Herbiconiux gentiana TaxID=2970912 RepID=A0ABT2GCF1_9MICO|nr:lytic murein transglycosylase [Herbiconiux gentiana]MCS5713891.1 lytic murein transglycosylase [Herbiconiux gentiana]